MAYDMQIVDDKISTDLRNRVWKYLLNSKWCATWKPVGKTTFGNYVPNDQGDYAHFMYISRPNFSTFQHRAAFASDETSLQHHPVLAELWNAINEQFDNQFEITGPPEGMPADPADTSWIAPPTVDTTLKPGWRVYASAQTDESQKRTHGVHRDSIAMDSDEYYTILFCANPEWYPTWFGDCVYYSDDTEGATGDTQQYQNKFGSIHQNRNFAVNWPERIVSPKSGRIIAYDGRWLHTTHPTAVWAPTPRRVVAFRVKKKS